MKRPSIFFEIYKLSADKIINCRHEYAGLSGNNAFRLNERQFQYCSVITKQPDCALFYQIMLMLRDQGGDTLWDVYKKWHLKDIEKKKELLDAFGKCFILVDFSEVIKENQIHVQDLIAKGFKIKFSSESDEEIAYSYFESSGSMRRNNVLSFVRTTMKDDLLKRITLDLDPKETNLSKWFAYKGLALSSGCRLPTYFGPPRTKKAAEDKGTGPIEFNKETVAIVDDVYDCSSECDLIEFKAMSSEQAKEHVWFTMPCENGTVFYQPVEDPGTVQVNLFDGGGIVTEDYALKIADFIRLPNESADSFSSFQIRAPFIKGMIHRISNVRDENGVEKSGLEYFFERAGADTVTDIFGINHKVSDLKFILPVSMFKYAGFIKKEKREFINYLKNAEEYGHALYVVGTNNVARHSSGFTKLNAQVLSTLDLPEQHFNRLILDLYTSLNQIKSDDFCFWTQLLLEKDDVDYQCLDEDDPGDTLTAEEEEPPEGSGPSSDPLEPEAPEEPADPEDAEDPSGDDGDAEDPDGDDGDAEKTGAPSVFKLLQKNPAFMKTSLVASVRKQMTDSVLKDFAVGRIPVEGGKYFLSGNLVELLYRLLPKKKKEKANNRSIADACKGIDYEKEVKLNADRFYLPGNSRLDGDKSYALFRNPHLSPYEHVSLKPFTPGKGSLHHLLFGKLSDVVMVEPRSLVPMALSGADFDGDIVAVIENESYNRAVEKMYKNRKVVIIPSPSGKGKPQRAYVPGAEAEEEEKNAIIAAEAEMLKQTFSSFVGIYSNRAFRFIVNNEENCQMKAAAMTAVVGLEIDSAKNGAKPDTKAELYLPNSIYSRYLTNKKYYQRYSSVNIEIEKVNIIREETNGTAGEKTAGKANGEEVKDGYDRSAKKFRLNGSYFPYNEKECVAPISPCTQNIERVPYLYCWMRFKKVRKDDEAAPGEKPKKMKAVNGWRLFSFEKANWVDDLDPKKAESVAALLMAYKTTVSNIHAVYRARNSGSVTQKKLDNVIRLQSADDEYTVPDKERLDAVVQFFVDSKEIGLDTLYKLKRRLYCVGQKQNEDVWQFNSLGVLKRLEKETDPDVRRAWEELNRFLDEKGNEEVKARICRFDNHGFNILYYLVCIAADRIRSGSLAGLNLDAETEPATDPEQKKESAGDHSETAPEETKEEPFEAGKNSEQEMPSDDDFESNAKKRMQSALLLKQKRREAAASLIEGIGKKGADPSDDRSVSESRSGASEKRTVKGDLSCLEEKYLKAFSEVSTKHENKSECLKEAAEMCRREMGSIVTQNGSATGSEEEEMLKYLYFLSPVLDPDWGAIRTVISGETLLKSALKVDVKKPVLTAKMYDKADREDKNQYEPFTYKGMDWYYLKALTEKQAVDKGKTKDAKSVENETGPFGLTDVPGKEEIAGRTIRVDAREEEYSRDVE